MKNCIKIYFLRINLEFHFSFIFDKFTCKYVYIFNLCWFLSYAIWTFKNLIPWCCQHTYPRIWLGMFDYFNVCVYVCMFPCILRFVTFCMFCINIYLLYVCIYIYIYMYIFIYMYICMWYIYVCFTYMYIFLYVYIYICIFICASLYVCVGTHLCLYKSYLYYVIVCPVDI